MDALTIRPITSQKDIMRFIKFQWKIYQNDPYWVPPLLMDRKKILSKEKNPFYQHADIQLFLAEQNGEIKGRIAAIKNDLHNKYHNDKVGFFGFFECYNDQNTANKLFDAAAEWLRWKGCDTMRGPANPSSNDDWGFLLEGFDDSPRILMPHTPKYYLELSEKYGFQKAKDLYAWKIMNQKLIQSEKLKRVAEIAAKRSGMVVEQMDMKNFREEVEKFKYVYNKAWAVNWGFVPLTDAEIDALAKDLKQLVEPSLVIFGKINGELVGAALVILDYNAIFKTMNGRLFPFNFIKLFTQKKKIKWARVITLGVIPQYQKRGLDAVFYWEIVQRAERIGILLGEASWILEDNDMMNRGAEVMNSELYKKYRLYDIKL